MSSVAFNPLAYILSHAPFKRILSSPRWQVRPNFISTKNWCSQNSPFSVINRCPLWMTIIDLALDDINFVTNVSLGKVKFFIYFMKQVKQKCVWVFLWDEITEYWKKFDYNWEYFKYVLKINFRYQTYI